MSQPRHHRINAMHFAAWRRFGALDHQYRQSQLAGGDELGAGADATGVLAHQTLDAMFTQQRQVTLNTEWPSVNGDGVVRQWGRRLRSIDQPQQIVVLRLSGKRGQMHASDGQQHALGRPRQCIHCCLDTGDTLPAVTGLRLPASTGQGDVLDACVSRGLHCMSAHLHGKGVGGIDQMGKGVLAQIGAQTLDTAEATDAGRQRLGLGGGDTSGIAEHGGNLLAGAGVGQCTGLAGATQNQDFAHG